MKLLQLYSILKREAVAALRDEKGLAVIELAFILPVGLTVVLGSYLAEQAYQVSAKAESAAAEVTDILSRQGTVPDAQVTTILNMSAAILTPYDSSNYKIVVSQLRTDANGSTTVQWSRTYQGTKLSAGSSVTLPSSIASPSSSLIYATASYRWTPPVFASFFGPITLSKTVYRVPRAGSVNIT